MTRTRPLGHKHAAGSAIACSGDPTAVDAVYLELSTIDRFTGNVLGK